MTATHVQPDTTHHALISFAQALGAQPHHEIYLSTPITTGQAFADWRLAHPDVPRGSLEWDMAQQSIVTANRRGVTPLVDVLRHAFPGHLIINPAGLDEVPGWGQDQYLAMWCEVIDTYAHAVVFAEGWQYSTGCSVEFAAATAAGIPTLSAIDLIPIDAVNGRTAIKAAIARLEHLGEQPDGLRGALATFDSATVLHPRRSASDRKDPAP